MIAIADYGMGNLRSVEKAFQFLGHEAAIVEDPASTREATHLVLPGDAAFGDAMRNLRASGWDGAIADHLRAGKPFLGICVGMQLMATTGREHGAHPGLGWIDGEVTAIDVRPTAERNGTELKIPHMGWNDMILDRADHPLFAGLRDGRHAYFVHSYAMICRRSGDQLAHVDYGGPLVAAVGRDNLVGTQFHPEKSQAVGLQIIGNFLSWRP